MKNFHFSCHCFALFDSFVSPSCTCSPSSSIKLSSVDTSSRKHSWTYKAVWRSSYDLSQSPEFPQVTLSYRPCAPGGSAQPWAPVWCPICGRAQLLELNGAHLVAGVQLDSCWRSSSASSKEYSSFPATFWKLWQIIYFPKTKRGLVVNPGGFCFFSHAMVEEKELPGEAWTPAGKLSGGVAGGTQPGSSGAVLERMTSPLSNQVPYEIATIIAGQNTL
jgi:hypothetical protein